MPERYRYTLTANTKTWNVQPLDGGCSLKWSREDDVQYYYRKQFNGQLVFYNSLKDGITDFDTIYTLGSANECLKFYVNIYKDCDWDTPIFEGEFTYAQCGVDLDRCRLTVTPETADIYRCFLERADERVNILDYTVPYYKATAYVPFYSLLSETAQANNIEIYGPGVSFYLGPGGCSYPLYSGAQWATAMGLPNIVGWSPYYFRITDNTGTPCGGGGPAITLDGSVKLKRWYTFTYNDELGNPVNPDPSSFQLVLDPMNTPSGQSKFVLLPGSTFNYPGTWQYTFTNNGSYNANILEGNNYNTPNYNGGDEIPLNRVRKVTDILRLYSDACELGFRSEFFDGSVNPVISELYPTAYTANPLNNLSVIPLYDFINYDQSNITYQYRIMRSYKELFEELHNLFQVCWFINDDDELQVEHISFFDNGFTYGAGVTTLDLTTGDYPTYTKLTNAWTIDEAEIQLVNENFKFESAKLPEWHGYSIKYDCGGRGQKEYLNKIITDLGYAVPLALTTETPPVTDQIILLCFNPTVPYTSTAGYVVNYDPIGIGQPNDHLSREALHHYYWRHHRQALVGKMNNEDTTFVTAVRRKKQVPISIPICCEDFEPRNLVLTALGEGQIEEAEYDLRKSALKMIIRYV